MYLRLVSAPAGLQPVKLGSVSGDVCSKGMRFVVDWCEPRLLLSWDSVDSVVRGCLAGFCATFAI